MGHLQQYRAQTVLVKARGQDPGRFCCVNGRIGKESSTMAKRSIRLERRTHIEEAIFDQQRLNCVPSGQRQGTHVFGDAPEAPGRPNAPTLYSGPDTDYHLFLSALFSGVGPKEACGNCPAEFFVNRDAALYERGIMELASSNNLVTSFRTKRFFFCFIVEMFTKLSSFEKPI